MVYRASGGVPRIINVICDAALVFGYAEERPQIDPQLLEEVLIELKATGVLPSTPPAGAPVAIPARGFHEPPPFSSPAIPAPAFQEPPFSAQAIPAPAFHEPPFSAQAIPATAVRSEPVAPRASLLSQDALARAAQETNERAAKLAAREQALANRERELAEQRRIMAEEYRLMHSMRRTATAAANPAPSERPATASRFAPEHKPGFLAWVKRILGGSRPAVEARH
jgi:hypothetical protein